MTSDVVYDFLKKNFEQNEPIFLSEIHITGLKDVSIRQQFKKLTEDGRLKRFDTGIYYIPKESMFRSGTTISIDAVIQKKYLIDGEADCGYVGGIALANQIGLTTQMPGIYEVYTNKATTDYRETKLANFRVIVRKPYVQVDSSNVKELQFLELMKDVLEVSEMGKEDLTERLLEYMKMVGIEFQKLEPFLSYYPDRIYKNLYEVGLLNGISA